MKSLAEMTDQELIDHLEALYEARVKILSQEIEFYTEQVRRRPRLRRYDPDQLDYDEYNEEMSIGGKPYWST